MEDNAARQDLRNIHLRDAEQFGRTVERLRLERGFDRPQFADRAGVSVKTLLAVERGTNQRRQQSTLLKLAQALDLGYDELMAEAGEETLSDADADDGARLGRLAPARRRLGRPLTAAAAALCLLAAATAWTEARQESTLPTFAVEDGRLVARDHRTGEMVWRLPSEAVVNVVRPLPDHDDQLLVGLGLNGLDAGWCMLVDRRSGEVQWRFRPEADEPAAVFDNPDHAENGGFSMMTASFPDLDGDGEREVAVYFMHNRLYPSAICVLDRHGRLQSTYWNWGHFYDCLVADLDGDGKDEMVWTATNNAQAYQGASLVLLDDECRRGASFDPISGGRLDIPDSARVRVVLPAHDLDFLATRGVPRLKAVRPSTRVGTHGEVRIQVLVCGNERDCAFVTFDTDLNPLSVTPTDPLILALEPWLRQRYGDTPPTVQQWLDDWLTRTVRYEAGHWPPSTPPS